MVISQTSQYALKALIFLLKESKEQRIKVKEISEALEVPQNYLSKIFHTLSRSGVLKSTPGKKGGFQLAKPANELLLTEIVKPFESSDFPQICILGQAVCSDEKPCPAHDKWKVTAGKIMRFFDTTTLHQVANRKNKKFLM